MDTIYSYSEDNIVSLFKVVIIGNSGVGKTNLLTKYINNEFNKNISPTIGVDFNNFQYTLNNKKYKLQIWDTAGQERFKEFAKSYFKGTHGVIIVYDITDKESFNNIEKWILKIKENLDIEKIKIILIGNKIDLIDERKIHTEEGLEYAVKYNLLYAETSALTNENNCINKGFEKLFEELIINYKEETNKEFSSLIKSNKEPIKPHIESGCCK